MRRNEPFLLLLCGVFCGCLVTAAVLTAKIVQIGPIAVPAGVFAYCFTFVCVDVISEIWGRRCANAVIFTGFTGIGLAFLLIQLTLAWPAAPFWKNEAAFNNILGMTPRVIIASLTAYALSQCHDVWLFLLLKKLTAGKCLWLRNNISTILSQLIDSVVFISIAFYGTLPLQPLILGQWTIKAALSVCATPLVYIMVHCARRSAAPEKSAGKS